MNALDKLGEAIDSFAGNETAATPWENLANAIVAQAADDYRSACRVLRRRPHNPEALYLKASAVSFFRGKRILYYTGIPGKELLEKLEKEQEDINEDQRVHGAVRQKNRTARFRAGAN